jgi:hypothetical protein
MSNQNYLVYALNKQVTNVGSLGIGNVKDESKIRFSITNAGPANVFRVRARIVGQPDWTTLIDYTGNVNTDLDVFSWDQIEVICLVYDSLSNFVRIVASSFDSQAGSTYQLPDSSEVEGSVIKFTSNDNSVTIVGDPINNEIDFSVGIVGSISKYVESFNDSTDWTLNVDEYTISIDQVTHEKGVNPSVYVLDNVDDVVQVTTNIDNLGNIIISVSATPDLRFAGKVIII